MAKQKLTVLILDDEEINLLMLGKILEMNGCQVIQAININEAIEKALAWKPDLAFIDFHLGRENGLDALDLMVKEAGFNGHAYGASGSLDESEIINLKSKLYGFIDKPYDKDAIKNIITKELAIFGTKTSG